MRALITGIGGFAGSHLAEHLADSGDEVHGVLHPGESDANLRGVAGRVRLREADVTDAEALRRVVHAVRPEHVYHLAGMAFVPDCAADPARAYTVNVVGTLHVHEAVQAEAPKARVLCVSSAEVYGRQVAGNVDETRPFAAETPYAASKVAADLLAQQWCATYAVDAVIARPFNHTGPRQSSKFVCSAFARQVAEAEAGLREPVLLTGNTEGARDFSDVRDIVRAYRLALMTCPTGGIYNLGSGRAVPIGEVVDLLLERAACPMSARTDPERWRPESGEPRWADTSAFRAQTGWQPAIPFSKTVADLLDYWRRKTREEPPRP